MQYIWNHTKTLINRYDGKVPLTHFLREYCRKNPILGSRDRKMLAAILYSWYRCSKGILPTTTQDLSLEQKVKACLTLCNAFTPHLEKLFISDETSPAYTFNPALLFPHHIPLSQGINLSDWEQSMLVQPRLFLRIRSKQAQILALLSEKQIEHHFVAPRCLSLPNGAPIDKLLPPDSYVVQDASSQLTGSFFNPRSGEHWYDCCAGAGGKSLLLVDAMPSVKLTITDKRASIIANLKERFHTYHLPAPRTAVADAANAQMIATVAGTHKFDNIICDVPCSGSGTWARTPEQLHFFNPASIPDFSALQCKIATNVAAHLKEGGKLIYITCSVFSAENEDVVQQISRNTRLQVVSTQCINGIAQGADSMFVAVLQ